jgi:hypothetical protein
LFADALVGEDVPFVVGELDTILLAPQGRGFWAEAVLRAMLLPLLCECRQNSTDKADRQYPLCFKALALPF